jgi:plasmid stabilization system protein ParE
MGGRTPWAVAFTRHAEEDILGIFAFITEKEGPDMAEAILEKFMQARDSLAEFPDRGRVLPELKRVGIVSYREIQVKPWRVIYHVNNAAHAVHIHVVADGRRNFTELLKERLLTPPTQHHPAK